jgi:signal transduction histidine kinase
MLEDIIRDFTVEINSWEVDFIIHHPCSDVVFGDMMRMRLIFRNLLSNAIRFRNRHAPLKVLIDIRKETDLIFTVQDNGIGIAPHYHEKIFEMFFKADAERSGVGLGLYIVKEVIGILKGSITVQSDIGQGSVFIVQLPLAAA